MSLNIPLSLITSLGFDPEYLPVFDAPIVGEVVGGRRVAMSRVKLDR